MKKILTYEEMINYSINEIEMNIINAGELYNLEEKNILREIFNLILKKFDEYESRVEQINESFIIINKDKKIVDIFKYYENILRVNN